MKNEIRQITAEFYEDMFDLAAYAFNAERSEERKKRFEQVISRSLNYGCFVDNKLISQVISTPFQVNFHGRIYQMAGIGGVSSYPEYRGQGSISAIIQALFLKLSENEVALAYLAPFSYPFYRKYGFEQLFEQIDYRIKAAHWPTVSNSIGQMKRANWTEAKKSCNEIYLKMERNQRGAIVREEWWNDYNYCMKEQYQFALYENQGKIEGYLIYQSTSEYFEIKEWGYTNKEAFYGLVHFIGSHRGSSQEFRLESGFDGENLSYLMPAPLVEMKIQPSMMGRIVNIQLFLSTYPFNNGKEETYYLKLEDEYAPWNAGLWLLKITGTGSGELQKVDVIDKEAFEIETTIQHFTQFLMRYRSGSELYFFGKVHGNLEVIHAFDERLPEGRPILEDHF